MRYSICIIDDAFPTESFDFITDTELLNSSNLKFLLDQKDVPWREKVLKELVEDLNKEQTEDGQPQWKIYGYKNPKLFLNNLEDDLFRTEVIIYDWDYPGSGTGSGLNSEDTLLEILESTFSLLFIFSGADKEDEIKRVITSEKFERFKERLFYLDKKEGKSGQTDLLLTQVQSITEENFSFNFAKTVRNKALQSIDKFLSDIGKATLNDVKNNVFINKSVKKDFIDYLTENFKMNLSSTDIYNIVDQIPDMGTGNSVDPKIVERMWSYRLYFLPSFGDDLVRCGDIIEKNGNYHLVISTDCDITRFWKKNLGVVNYINLYDITNENKKLEDRLSLCNDISNLKDLKSLNSLLSTPKGFSEGPFILPFVPYNDDFKFFLAFPKEINFDEINSFPTNL
jgi:hypothetical protein